ncbi:hypothetical protein CPARA_2gp210 (nucleomorph) [Cryptomonas paramecium]|uniref:Uncharacterized protein n=1 Tax=Cryptomonas paramaecium TaxID=2898 RepID=F2HHS2_9CRYP|nr:hypothetical protein CPARA_2gp210 [Cryptomonas paramecium]AEA38868.1 hypothetical protein CPARA_2gp210 [Cryptomonas paramecium]
MRQVLKIFQKKIVFYSKIFNLGMKPKLLVFKNSTTKYEPNFGMILLDGLLKLFSYVKVLSL